MKKFTNTYIFTFSAIMVVIVAAVLSVVAMQLQPMQKKNMEINKMQNILLSLNIQASNDSVMQKYDQYIADSYVINHKGERKESLDAFSVNLAKEIDKAPENRDLPVFVASHGEDGKQYVVPVRGKGLWGPIWGYVALEDDYNTIYGTNFAHQSETPGLGAEIANRPFQKQFIGKKIFNEQGEFVSVDVIKKEAPPDAPHAVDGISGGTITSNGVDEMLKEIIGIYVPYFKEKQKNN